MRFSDRTFFGHDAVLRYHVNDKLDIVKAIVFLV